MLRAPISRRNPSNWIKRARSTRKAIRVRARHVIGPLDNPHEKRGAIGLRLFEELDRIVAVIGRRFVPIARVVDV